MNAIVLPKIIVNQSEKQTNVIEMAQENLYNHILVIKVYLKSSKNKCLKAYLRDLQRLFPI